MAKKPTISPRKPPGSVDPAAAASFVTAAGGSASGAASSKHSDTQTSERPNSSSVITRQDGRQLKRTTVYLPPGTAKRLAVRCAELDMELSAAMTEAIEAWLSRKS